MSEKTMPSGSNLPLCWTDDMDRFICHCDALGEYDYDDIVAALRDKFPELRDVSVSFEDHWMVLPTARLTSCPFLRQTHLMRFVTARSAFQTTRSSAAFSFLTSRTTTISPLGR